MTALAVISAPHINFRAICPTHWEALQEMGVVDERGEIDQRRYQEWFDELLKDAEVEAAR